VQIRVYYEDTDAGGVVYHANYLKFCERARSELFFERGLSPEIDGGHFVVSQIEASFHSPAKLGDMLIVKNTIIDIKGASLRLKQEIFKEDKKLFSITSTLVFVIDGKPCRLKPHTKALLDELFRDQKGQEAS